MVFCTYCGQSFTRDEHLERHILTHTNVKPFKCFTCHMSFARRDLLQRHYTVHGRDQNQEPIPASNGMIPKSAGRTPIACSNCAKTKTKCDKKFPCSRCAGRNLKCTLRPTRRATKNAARMGIPVEGAVTMPPGTQAPGVDGPIQPQQLQPQPPPPPPSTTTTTTTTTTGATVSLPSPTQQQSVSPQQMMKMPSPKTTMAPIPEEVQMPTTLGGLSAQFLEGSAGGPTSTISSSSISTTTSYSPPVQTPGFAQATPFTSSFDGLAPVGKDLGDDVTSPRFMLDWAQMQMPMGYDTMVPMMGADLGFDPGALTLAPSNGGVFGLMHGPPPPLMTPNGTPRVDSAFSDLEFRESSNGPPPLPPPPPPPPQQQQQQQQHHHHQHQQSLSQPPLQRNHSMPSNASSSMLDTHSGEMAAIVAAQDAWSAFRCLPVIPAAACPRTARLNLERLEQTLRNQQVWSTWSPQWDEADLAAAEGDHLTVMQLHESTRDKLLAITQSFLHKALDIHRDAGSHPASSMGGGGGGVGGSSNFVLLPPARVLEYFLRSYVNCFEQYFPVTSRGTLDVNELMHCYNDRAASLLVLMMIAQGAMNIPSTEARMLTGGLTEACRISLFDLIEKDIIMAGDHVVLHAALLFTVQAAWSGDKWQMDIAMGQRGMYLAMLRHSGLLESRPLPPGRVDQRQNTDHLWSEWIQNEARSRLVYSWAMVDQDMALFYDTAPLFSVTEFHAPMPDADRLWHARSAAEWSMIFEQVHEFAGGYSSVGSGARPLSLKDLFRHFLDDEMIPLGIETTPLQLRLLLHPLQSLVCQFAQLLNCFSEPLSNRDAGTSRVITAATTRHRLEEVQSLLQRWYDLAERYLKANSMCAMMRTNLVIYHLISLNAVANFPDIERLARRETFDGSHQKMIWLHKNCILDAEEAIFHCGQVLRLVRGMPRGARPPWWAGALYRVALILWTDSLVHKDSPSPASTGGAGGKGGSGGGANMLRVPGPSFAVDALAADHPLIVRYLTKREGVPCVTKRDGSQMPLDRAYSVLQYCVEVIDEGAATRFSDGIRAKLDRLARG